MKQDTYELVTQRIIAKLQAGTIPWKHFASSPLAEPKNLVSKKAYSGINRLLLSGTKYNSEFWLTYKQTQDMGGNVRKGEKSELVVFWKFLDVEDKDAQPGETSLKAKQIPFLRHYSLFNAEQTEGIDYAKIAKQEPRETDPIEAAESIVRNMPSRPRIVIDKTPKAFYSSTEDYVHMTERSACTSDAAYYDTLDHELIHSTGAASRLNRFQQDGCNHHFGSKSYACEELVAQMGAAFLMSECGLFQETEDNSAAYIANWLSRLENDNKLVVQASGKAQKACDYILNRTAQPLQMAA
jgi:antirestriction protein ArdC